MTTLKFKSNIKCAGCLEKVSPVLNAEPMLETWEVDIYTPEKILTINTYEANTEKVIDAIEKAVGSVGFKMLVGGVRVGVSAGDGVVGVVTGGAAGVGVGLGVAGFSSKNTG